MRKFSINLTTIKANEEHPPKPIFISALVYWNKAVTQQLN